MKKVYNLKDGKAVEMKKSPTFLKAQKLLTLSVERQLRCGDGGVKGTISHSVNCECERIDKEIKELEAQA